MARESVGLEELTGLSVELTRVVAAKPATVFRYFVDAERFSRWLGAAVEIDARPGGRLRIDFAAHRTVVVGEMLAVEPDRRIAFSWGVERGDLAERMPVGSTRVTITLVEVAGGTRVELRHEGLPDVHQQEEHRGGWEDYLERLAVVAST